jgi:hypothetical protein
MVDLTGCDLCYWKGHFEKYRTGVPIERKKFVSLLSNISTLLCSENNAISAILPPIKHTHLTIKSISIATNNNYLFTINWLVVTPQIVSEWLGGDFWRWWLVNLQKSLSAGSRTEYRLSLYSLVTQWVKLI